MSIARLSALLCARLLCAGLLALGVAGCENTMRGFGQDMQKTGKAIEKATGTGGSTSSGQAAPKTQ